MKFKTKPEPLPALPNAEEVARFAAGAGTRTVEHSAVAVVPPPAAEDQQETAAPTVEQDDKTAQPHTGINLRLNKYEHDLLKFLAAADTRSLQQTIKRLLMPAAEAAAAAIRSTGSRQT